MLSPAGRRRPTGWGAPPVIAPGIDEVRRAHERLRGITEVSPLVPCPGLPGVALKLETVQPTGSFKLRGAWNWAAQLAEHAVRRGFSTFSAGNTALALGWCARRLGTSCRSLIPDYAPAFKVAALRSAGVEPVLVPFETMAEWLFRAGWQDEPWSFLHPWTEPAMLAGHATIALELLEQLPAPGAAYIPVGGGALCAGVGSALKALCPDVRIVAVQSAAYPALAASRAAGRPAWIEPGQTICDGVAVPFVTDAMFPLLEAVVDEVVVVGDSAVLAAIEELASVGVTAEGAGALALAAARAGDDVRRIVCLVTGANRQPA
jgi:threonine dehydratase